LKKEKVKIYKELDFVYFVNGRKFINKEKAKVYAELLNNGDFSE